MSALSPRTDHTGTARGNRSPRRSRKRAEVQEQEYVLLRHRMVEHQLRARGISDQAVLAAMGDIPRHLFVPSAARSRAYDDAPLPIGFGQTISQPYMVARMTELLGLTEQSRVLEVGTGSGYQAAVLAALAGQVWSIERIPDLARRAEELLARLGYDNVTVVAGDGTVGLSEAAPYDAIIVAAAAPRVPETLRRQLDLGGRMVIPVSAGYAQDLLLVERLPDLAPATASGKALGKAPECEPSYRETNILGCVFVPLIGAEGYEE